MSIVSTLLLFSFILLFPFHRIVKLYIGVINIFDILNKMAALIQRKVNAKVKQSHYRPGQAQKVPEG